MTKRFNTTGSCNPERHYMVNIDDKLEQIMDLIDEGLYFTINRARQFGKTTTMKRLQKNLEEDYYVYFISFETDADMFSSAEEFCKGFFSKLSKSFNIKHSQNEYWNRDFNCKNFENLAAVIRNFCSKLDKPVVLMIDEVDKSTNNQLFLNFLGMMRNMYLDRDTQGMNSTFHSVILTGVYDVKNLKLKINDNEEIKYNSPWNIAVRFNVDMTLSAEGIKGMLDEYEMDHHTGMDTQVIADEIRKFTSGYPILVSYICSLIHEEFEGDWTIDNVRKAVKWINGSNLLDDATKNLENHPNLKKMMKDILLYEKEILFELDVPTIRLANMFCLIKKDDVGHVAIHNLVIEQKLYSYFMAEQSLNNDTKLSTNRSIFIRDNKLNMPLVIERFKELLEAEPQSADADFLEKHGRLLFLCYLKPIINGNGFFYIDPETRNDGRMNILVSFEKEEFIIELKNWRGTKYEQQGKDQVAEFAKAHGKKKAYLITFSFLKEKEIQESLEWKKVSGVDVYEGIIWAKVD